MHSDIEGVNSHMRDLQANYPFGSQDYILRSGSVKTVSRMGGQTHNSLQGDLLGLPAKEPNQSIKEKHAALFQESCNKSSRCAVSPKMQLAIGTSTYACNDNSPARYPLSSLSSPLQSNPLRPSRGGKFCIQNEAKPSSSGHWSSVSTRWFTC